jgi:hypothetical protein
MKLLPLADVDSIQRIVCNAVHQPSSQGLAAAPFSGRGVRSGVDFEKINLSFVTGTVCPDDESGKQEAGTCIMGAYTRK